MSNIDRGMCEEVVYRETGKLRKLKEWQGGMRHLGVMWVLGVRDFIYIARMRCHLYDIRFPLH